MKKISDACPRLGVLRQHYDDIKNTLAEEGIEGLMEKTRSVSRIRNRLYRESENATRDP